MTREQVESLAARLFPGQAVSVSLAMTTDCYILNVAPNDRPLAFRIEIGTNAPNAKVRKLLEGLAREWEAFGPRAEKLRAVGPVCSGSVGARGR